MREAGSSYAQIAQALGIKRAREAHTLFMRALGNRPDPDRAAMARRESQRLDQLEARIRSRDAHDPEKMTRRLGALEDLRQGLR